MLLFSRWWFSWVQLSRHCQSSLFLHSSQICIRDICVTSALWTKTKNTNKVGKSGNVVCDGGRKKCAMQTVSLPEYKPAFVQRIAIATEMYTGWKKQAFVILTAEIKNRWWGIFMQLVHLNALISVCLIYEMSSKLLLKSFYFCNVLVKNVTDYEWWVTHTITLSGFKINFLILCLVVCTEQRAACMFMHFLQYVSMIKMQPYTLLPSEIRCLGSITLLKRRLKVKVFTSSPNLQFNT